MWATRKQDGFTMLEILIVVLVIGILAALVTINLSGSNERSYKNRADTEMQIFANAAKLYVLKYNTYPADVDRGIPSEIKEFIANNQSDDEWPKAPWPNSIYDYEAWNLDGQPGNETVQMSIRYCPINGPRSACTFPDQPWAEDFNVQSSYYYCFTGYCRPHKNQNNNYPGYCINCPNNQAIKLPSES